MKKIALSAVSLAALTTSVLAADLPSRKEPVIAPPPPPMWTGFHVGLNAGGTWANNSSLNATTWNVANGDGGSAADEIDAALFSGNFGGSGAAGFIGGGQVGYDHQFSGINGYGIIAGLEADIQGIAGSNGNGSRLIGAKTFGADIGGIQADAYTLANQQVSASLSYLGTVRGRLGVLVTPTLLVYGTGGLAYGGVNASVRNYAIGTVDVSYQGTRLDPPGPEAFTSGTSSYSSTQVGYTAGGGVEWMFMPNWSAKAEYLYYDLGKVSGTTYNIAYPLIAGGGAPELSNITNYTARVSGNIVRAGVNYHFNWGSAPVVAKF
jgi:outer membrane immunogenic protein